MPPFTSRRVDCRERVFSTGRDGTLPQAKEATSAGVRPSMIAEAAVHGLRFRVQGFGIDEGTSPDAFSLPPRYPNPR